MSLKIIAFAGVDGSGKTTQLNMLRDYFKQNNVSFNISEGYKPRHYVKEIQNNSPVNSSYEDYYSSNLISNLLIHDLWININDSIKESREKNHEFLILNRYFNDSLAYSYSLGSDTKLLQHISKIFPKPDLYIFLDLDSETSELRQKDRGDVITKLRQKDSLHIKNEVASRYRKLLKKEKYGFIVNCNQKTKETVFNEILNKVKEEFNESSISLIILKLISSIVDYLSSFLKIKPERF